MVCNVTGTTSEWSDVAPVKLAHKVWLLDRDVTFLRRS